MNRLSSARFLLVAVALAVGIACWTWSGPANAWFHRNHDAAKCEHTQARLARNKQAVVAFYTTAFNAGKPAEAVQRYVGVDASGEKTYTQHNPQAIDGPQGFIDFVTGFKAAYPELNVAIVRVVAEDDLVITHSHLTLSPSDRGSVGADIFRLDDDGKIVEHWDVIQAIPETSANDNGMF
jgi:predicted SnoaL-like aldol condensation-catalyzing enzyme